MLLRDRLNEFELDWAQAPLRSGLIPDGQLQGKKIAIFGDGDAFEHAIAWSFMAWNDARRRGVQIVGAAVSADGTGFAVTERYTEDSFAPEEADYVILTGRCCREVPETAAETISYLQDFGVLLDALCKTGCARILLLSDGRVYGRLGHGFAASEYEAGATDPCAPGFEAQYLLQALEGMLTACARAAGKAFQILRTGLIYGPCVPMMPHPAVLLAEKTAEAQEFSLTLSQDKNSYICIHDVLTAVQFVLTKCPENKILNASGRDSDATVGELVMLLYDNFPEQCKVTLTYAASDASAAFSGAHAASSTARGMISGEKGTSLETNDIAPETNVTLSSACSGIWLNTQLLRHYGFRPAVSLEDGLIILVKSLQNTGEVFIFDNTYLGKLEKVQKILLAYLLEIDRICRKYNIKYFLAGGTLLGAIRHHGFIPWDDDADVMMLREDYEKFQAVAQEEMPGNIFMQIPQTEKGNYNPFTKLRIDNTMFATKFTGNFMNMHNGIFFDVLAHDRTGQHKWSQKLHLMITMFTRSVVFNKWGDTDIAGGGGHPIVCKIVDRLKYLIPMPLALWAQNHSLEFFRNRRTGYLYDGMGRNLKRGAFPAKWLEEAVYVDFEGYQFPVPKEYDKYLTYLYGDYMQMIPVSQRRTSHSIVLMDLGEYADFTLGKKN